MPTEPIADASAPPIPAASATASATVFATVSPAAPRVVLDSNIWVDLLVFRDPYVEPIRAALAAGTIAPVIRADCREELRRVLEYPQFARFGVDNAAALAEVDRYTTLEPTPGEAEIAAARLARCRDTDDQKFVELAHFSRAAVLVSKDKAVLKLRSRLRRSSGVEILQPAAFGPWLAAWQSTAAEPR